jgi:hypothetical protein
MVQTGQVYEYGLYCGPNYGGPHIIVTPGAIRACVKAINGQITIYTTQDYKCVSEGYSININPNIDRGLIGIMRNLATTMDNDIINQQNIEDDLRDDEQQLVESTDASLQQSEIVPTQPATTMQVFRSRRLNKEVPEYVPVYYSYEQPLSIGRESLVQNQIQSGSELRGDLEQIDDSTTNKHDKEDNSNDLLTKVGLLENYCFFSETAIPIEEYGYLFNETIVHKQSQVINKNKRRRMNKLARNKDIKFLNNELRIIADNKYKLEMNSLPDSNDYKKSKGIRNGKNSVSMYSAEDTGVLQCVKC